MHTASPATIRSAPDVIASSLVVPVAAGADATRRALHRLDLAEPATRALRAMGMADRLARRPGGLTWRPEGMSGHVDVDIDVRVEPAEEGSHLSIITRFSATDAITYSRLLDAWPLVRPLADHLTRRAARSVRDHAEDDRFAEPEPTARRALAA